MKTKLMTLLIVALGFVAINAKAQTKNDESRVKIMNTNRPGVLRLIHAIGVDETVTVKFIAASGEISSDEIKGNFPKGISKRYDVRKIANKDFRMEISTSHLTITYLIVPSKDRKTFTPYLEKSVHNYALASLN